MADSQYFNDQPPIFEPKSPEPESVYEWQWRRILVLFFVCSLVIGFGARTGWDLTHESAAQAAADSQAAAVLRNTQVQNELDHLKRVTTKIQDHYARQKQLQQQRQLAKFWKSTLPFETDRMRSANSTDDLPDWTDDGLACSTDCAPPGSLKAWPLKPFYKPKPIISFLNDARPASFHHGIDITASSHQLVYAIQPGWAHIIQATGPDERVQIGNYIYWHVYIRVREGQYITPLQTIIGGVQPGFGHLHLSEVDSQGQYLNPLRPGHVILPGWTDQLAPTLGFLDVSSDGSLVVDAYDSQSLRSSGPYITPVTNLAALAYRLWLPDGSTLEWAQRGTHNYDYSLFDSIYSDYQTSTDKQKCYSKHRICNFLWHYVLAGGLAPGLPVVDPGDYKLSVYAWDWAGNVSARDYQLSYDNGWGLSGSSR